MACLWVINSQKLTGEMRKKLSRVLIHTTCSNKTLIPLSVWGLLLIPGLTVKFTHLWALYSESHFFDHHFPEEWHCWFFFYVMTLPLEKGRYLHHLFWQMEVNFIYGIMWKVSSKRLFLGLTLWTISHDQRCFGEQKCKNENNGTVGKFVSF